MPETEFGLKFWHIHELLPKRKPGKSRGRVNEESTYINGLAVRRTVEGWAAVSRCGNREVVLETFATEQECERWILARNLR